jgi:hypothetical protein
MMTLAMCCVAIVLGAFAGAFVMTRETELAASVAMAMVFATLAAIILAVV